jgi:nitroreductase
VLLNLSVDEVLTTTRAVRRRFDLQRPVERDVLEDCLRIAQQAPTGSNRQTTHFVVITDAELRSAIAVVYRRGAAQYRQENPGLHRDFPDESQRAAAPRIGAAAEFLMEHLHEVPVHVLVCVEGSVTDLALAPLAGQVGSVFPAIWSFMLAARSRGLGTCLTTVHLRLADEVAALVGLPDDLTQMALIPTGYTVGTDFRPASRRPLSDIVHWNHW